MQTQAIQQHRPPFNAVLQAATLKVAAAIEKLSQRGMAVVSVELDTPSRPTIRIQTSAKCQQMIAAQQAVYYSFGQSSHFGPYREGQFMLDGCRIVWMEFGH